MFFNQTHIFHSSKSIVPCETRYNSSRLCLNVGMHWFEVWNVAFSFLIWWCPTSPASLTSPTSPTAQILGKTLHQLFSWQLQNWLSEFHLGGAAAHLDSHVRDQQLIMTVKAEMMESRPKRATLPSGQIFEIEILWDCCRFVGPICESTAQVKSSQSHGVETHGHQRVCQQYLTGATFFGLPKTT